MWSCVESKGHGGEKSSFGSLAPLVSNNYFIIHFWLLEPASNFIGVQSTSAHPLPTKCLMASKTVSWITSPLPGLHVHVGLLCRQTLASFIFPGRTQCLATHRLLLAAKNMFLCPQVTKVVFPFVTGIFCGKI